jgi:hypothetical protein
VAADVRAGVVSVAGALEEYGAVVDAEGRVDAAATEGLRRRRNTPADPVA